MTPYAGNENGAVKKATVMFPFRENFGNTLCVDHGRTKRRDHGHESEGRIVLTELIKEALIAFGVAVPDNILTAIEQMRQRVNQALSAISMEKCCRAAVLPRLRAPTPTIWRGCRARRGLDPA